MASHYLAEIERLRGEVKRLQDLNDVKSERLQCRRQDNAALRRNVERLSAEVEALRGRRATYRGKRVLAPMEAQP